LKSTGEPNRAGQFSSTLFHGDAEARREHYLSLALPVLESGLNVLILLPDHGIAGEYFHKFLREKIGHPTLPFGSQVTTKRKAEVYLRMRKQGGFLVVGTRSCLFLPAKRTGLVIVERPEDDGYRNDQALQFNAVTVAAKLAELQQIPICYGSVSPPLDLMKGVEEGFIQSISGARVAPSTGKAVGASPSRGRSLWMSCAPRRIKARFALPTGDTSQAEDPGCKPGGECQAVPGLGFSATPVEKTPRVLGVSPWESIGREPAGRSVEIIRIKRFRMGEKPPPELADLIIDGFDSNERIAIHTPLKDYAARLYCLSCRGPIVCPICDSGVSYSKADNRLLCWRCGRHFVYEERCKRCGSELIGFGSTGAEYVEEHIRSLGPAAFVIKVTADVVKNEGMDRLVDLWKEPRTVIVGTQILSKFYGIAADRLILIGWEDFLRIGGYRAREHMHQTYCNLIDALRPSKVHLLTTDGAKEPGEILTMNGEDFYKQELEQRRMAEFPPYSRIFLINIDAPNRTAAQLSAKRVRDVVQEFGRLHHVIGEAVRPGERGRISILLRSQVSLTASLIDGLYRLRHVRIEADPTWI
jgi:primosomal protein N'